MVRGRVRMVRGRIRKVRGRVKTVNPLGLRVRLPITGFVRCANIDVIIYVCIHTYIRIGSKMCGTNVTLVVLGRRRAA